MILLQYFPEVLTCCFLLTVSQNADGATKSGRHGCGYSFCRLPKYCVNPNVLYSFVQVAAEVTSYSQRPSTQTKPVKRHLLLEVSHFKPQSEPGKGAGASALGVRGHGGLGLRSHHAAVG